MTGHFPLCCKCRSLVVPLDRVPGFTLESSMPAIYRLLAVLGFTGILCSPVSSGSISVFNVAADFAGNSASAFAVEGEAGGGTIFYPYQTAPYLVPPQAVGPNTKIICDQGVILQASTPTADIFDVTDEHVLIDGCSFNAAGTIRSSQQTGGAFVHNTGKNLVLQNLRMNGAYIAVRHTGPLPDSFITLRNVFSENQTLRTTAPGAALFWCDVGSIATLDNVTLNGTSAPQASWPTYGIFNDGCYIEASSSKIFNAQIGGINAPTSGHSAYFSGVNVSFDTDDFAGFVNSPNGGVVGLAQFGNSWFAPVGGHGLISDTTGAVLASVGLGTAGGAIIAVKVANSHLLNYTNGAGYGVYANGPHSELKILGNDIGQHPGLDFYTGIFTVNTGNFTIKDNSVAGTSGNSIVLSGSALPAYTASYNRLLGTALADAGTVAAGQTKLIGPNN